MQSSQKPQPSNRSSLDRCARYKATRNIQAMDVYEVSEELAVVVLAMGQEIYLVTFVDDCFKLIMKYSIQMAITDTTNLYAGRKHYNKQVWNFFEVNRTQFPAQIEYIAVCRVAEFIVSDAAFLLILAGGSSGLLHVIHVGTHDHHYLTRHFNAIVDIKTNREHRNRAFTASKDGQALMWCLDTNTVIKVFKDPLCAIELTTLEVTQTILYVAGSDGCITLWDIENAVQMRKLSAQVALPFIDISGSTTSSPRCKPLEEFFVIAWPRARQSSRSMKPSPMSCRRRPQAIPSSGSASTRIVF